MSLGSRTTSSILWEIVAPYVRWPLRSPRRAGGVLLAAVLLLALVTRMHPGTTGSDTASSATAVPWSSGAVTASPGDQGEPGASPTSPAPVPTPAGATSDGPTVTAPAPGVVLPSASATPFTPTPVPDDPTAVAEAFVTAWARRGASSASWHEGVGHYTTSGLAGELASTDPRRVPASRRDGPGTLGGHTATTAQVTVPTDGGSVAVDLTHASGRWLVAAIRPAFTAPVASPPAMTRQPAPAASPATSPAASSEG